MSVQSTKHFTSVISMTPLVQFIENELGVKSRLFRFVRCGQNCWWSKVSGIFTSNGETFIAFWTTKIMLQEILFELRIRLNACNLMMMKNGLKCFLWMKHFNDLLLERLLPTTIIFAVKLHLKVLSTVKPEKHANSEGLVRTIHNSGFNLRD